MSDDIINPVTDENGDPEWDVAGYTDWEGNYHEVDDYTEIDFDDVDILTIEWTDAVDGTAQYAVLTGPFDDYEELEDIVDTYFEEGTP